MLTKLFQISDENSGSVTFDWVVLAAGVFSLGVAVTLTASHNANAATQPAPLEIAVIAAAN